MFPGDSQQGVGELGLLNVPSIKLGPLESLEQEQQQQPTTSAAPAKSSPFSGISQFDLFLADPPPAALQADSMAAPAVQSESLPPANTTAAGFPAVSTTTVKPDTGAGEDSFLQQPSGLQQPAPLAQLTPATSPFSAPAPQQMQQDLGLSSGDPLAGLAVGMGMPAPQQQQLMPPPLPQLPMQQQVAGLPMQLQPQQVQFAPLVSPLLLPQQRQSQFPVLQLGLPYSNQPHTLPQFGQPALGQQQQQAAAILQLNQQLLLQQQQKQQQGQLAQQQQYQPQFQQQQQQPFDFQFGDFGDADDDGGSDGGEQQHQAGHTKRRGRPPKVPGQYSKGYEAIKRYRQKKKGMVRCLV